MVSFPFAHQCLCVSFHVAFFCLQLVESSSFTAEHAKSASVNAEHARMHSSLMSYIEQASASAQTHLAELHKQRESLLWEKYNVDSLTFDVMMARYPVMAEEIYAEIDAHEWFVDSGVVDMPKGWGVLVLDQAGKPTARPAEVEDDHHH
jgi:hypothetical protein